MATDLFLEMAELPATGSLGTGQLDTRDLLVAGVPISISSKYLYLYLYKIYAKALANYLEMVTDQLIGKQQNLFIKHRSLVDNLFVTKEVISYLNRKNLPGVIAVVDFEKCFDRIEHNSIKAVFKYFGFGPNFCAMLMLLFKDIELCTSNNGYMSPLFDKGREINQGYPASPLVHAYCGEILNHIIKENSNITGVPFEHLQNILSQFADDTTLRLNWDSRCHTIR